MVGQSGIESILLRMCYVVDFGRIGKCFPFYSLHSMARFFADNRASRFNFTTSCPSFNDADGVTDSNDIGDSLGWPVTQSEQKDP